MAAPSPIETATRLCSFERRGAGTDAERRAANDLAARLQSSGRRVEVEPTYVHPQWAWVHAIHAALGIAGSVVAGFEAAAGFGLVLLAAMLMYLDLSGSLYVVRRLFFRRASQNVVAAAVAERPGPPIVLCASYDAPRTGVAYGHRARSLLSWGERALGLPLGGLRLTFIALILLLPPLGARMAGVDDVAALQLPQTLALIAAVALLARTARAPVGPGANDNASGVAAAIAAFEELEAEPLAHAPLRLALIGGGATSHEGLRALLRTHRNGVATRGATFIHLDSVGVGTVSWIRAEGPLVSTPASPALASAAEALAEAAAVSPAPIATAHTSGAFMSSGGGRQSIGISARIDGETRPPFAHQADDRPQVLEPAALDAATALAVGIARLADRAAGRFQ